MTTRQRDLNWTNVWFLTLSPLLGIVGTAVYARFNGVTLWELIPFAVLAVFTGLSITGGYHRYFAHRSYKANPLVKFFYLVFGACALQNTALRWASDHRLHHRYPDTDRDPYNAKEGFFYSHMGWIFYSDPANRSFNNVRDLLRDKLVMWQERYYIPVAIGVGFLIPTLIGLAIGHPLGGLLWGGFLRVVLVHHMTFLINSWAHIFGTQPYATSDSSRDCWWLAFLTNGEGYHNFHHKFQADYRNGVRWFQWDPTKWLVWTFCRLGLARDLNRVPVEVILKARIDSAMAQTESRLEHLSEEVRAAFEKKLAANRLRVEQVMIGWSHAKTRYAELKISAQRDSEEALLHYKQLLKHRRAELRKTTAEWTRVLRNQTWWDLQAV